jgi:RNA polymerase sigma-70 factor (ECF subfamily)
MVPPPPAPADQFATTVWSLVLKAQGPDPAAARAALADLCRAYWYPVYAYVRRRTGSAEQAEDLTQGFFAHLLDGDALAAADPSRGRFRAFLLTCCGNYLANERDRQAAQKRGGGKAPIPLDAAAADGRYLREPADRHTPDRVFAREWALTLLDAALSDLEAEYAAAGNAALYARLRPTLTAAPDAPRYADVATELGMTEGAVKKAAQRLRERYGECLRLRVAGTLDDPDQVDDEIRGLFAALAEE